MSESTRGGPMAWWVWALAVTFVVYLFSFQTGYAIVNPSVQKDLGLSIAQVGTIAAVYTWAFAIAQFFGGALLDRLGARAVIPISIALVTLGIFIFANATSYPMLLLSQVVIAIGSCTGFVGAGYIGGQWFGMAKFSVMFGLVQVVAALTSAFSQNLSHCNSLYFNDITVHTRLFLLKPKTGRPRSARSHCRCREDDCCCRRGRPGRSAPGHSWKCHW